MQLETWFETLWREYTLITPQAQRIYSLFSERGETVVNDHVAFRTFDASPISLERLEPLISELGYHRFATYQFPKKYLRAYGYVHSDPLQPRIYLSELRIKNLSPGNRALVDAMVQHIPESAVQRQDVFWAGRLWPIPSYANYEKLLAESEYAAWLSAWGLRANHFTISVNHLHTTPDLQRVLALVKSAGFRLNSEGGEIKGSPEVLLEQGSTLADRIEFDFADGTRKSIPSCYFEFAKRYVDERGVLYQGFVPSSAERLGMSTHYYLTG